MAETTICPKCSHIAFHDSYFKAMCCRQCGWMQYDKSTNADRIRTMSDEELAEDRVAEFSGLAPCPMWAAMDVPDKMYLSKNAAVEVELEYLRQPAEEG